MSVRKTGYLLPALLLAWLMVACERETTQTQTSSGAQTAASTAPTGQPQPAAAATVRIGWATSPDTLNPGSAVTASATVIFEAVYDTMFKLQLDGSSYRPWLAQSWQTSADGKIWTLRIHEGVKFHDGTTLSAADVAFSYNFYHDHADFPYLHNYTQSFEQVSATDAQTVVITLNRPVPNMEYLLSYLYVLPEHIWSAHREGKAAAEFDNMPLIGSGPLRLAEYRQNEFVALAAVKDYWQQPARVDQVVFQSFASADAMVQALLSGQVDLINDMPKTAAAALLRNPQSVTLVSGAQLAP
jgi:peptide/nickel transport system substrate-binding protein